MRTDAPKFCTVAKEASLESSLLKKEKWLSEKEALEKMGGRGLEKHTDSGRVVWKETSSCGVYEYMDTQDWAKTTTGKKRQSWQLAQEFQQDDDEVHGSEAMSKRQTARM